MNSQHLFSLIHICFPCPPPKKKNHTAICNFPHCSDCIRTGAQHREPDHLIICLFIYFCRGYPYLGFFASGPPWAERLRFCFFFAKHDLTNLSRYRNVCDIQQMTKLHTTNGPAVAGRTTTYMYTHADLFLERIDVDFDLLRIVWILHTRMHAPQMRVCTLT